MMSGETWCADSWIATIGAGGRDWRRKPLGVEARDAAGESLGRMTTMTSQRVPVGGSQAWGSGSVKSRGRCGGWWRCWGLPWVVASLCLGVGCSRQDSALIQGYVEGEFVQVASPGPGVLKRLAVAKGVEVKPGDLLYELEDVAEAAAREEASGRLVQAQSLLEDVKKGRRPSEVAALEAQREQARVSWEWSVKERRRQEQLMGGTGAGAGATTVQELERARSTEEQGGRRLAQLVAELETARLGARGDLVSAAAADVRVREASVARAEWEWEQRRRRAVRGGRVFDTLYREGEWVPAGRPVVMLLPPEGIKVRTFVPQALLGRIRIGEPLRVRRDGVAEVLTGRVAYVAPQAEYTPPVIYSRENRAKLVYLVEIQFEPGVATGLHPGQPVDVLMGP